MAPRRQKHKPNHPRTREKACFLHSSQLKWKTLHGWKEGWRHVQSYHVGLDHQIRKSKVKFLPERLDNWSSYNIGLEGRLQRTRQVGKFLGLGFKRKVGVDCQCHRLTRSTWWYGLTLYFWVSEYATPVRNHSPNSGKTRRKLFMEKVLGWHGTLWA